MKTIVKVVPNNERMTSDIISNYELTEIIGIRTNEIEKGGPIFTDPEGLIKPELIAKKELLDKKCPLQVIRKLPNGNIEVWKCNEMAIDLTNRRLLEDNIRNV